MSAVVNAAACGGRQPLEPAASPELAPGTDSVARRAGGRRWSRWLPLTLAVMLACGAGDTDEQEPRAQVASESGRSLPPAGRAWVIFGTDTVVAEVARSADERSQGLMYRDAVPDGTGMLFVFPDVQVRSFWMANTYVPLDIAFLDTSFRIVDIIAMEPLVTDPMYTSSAPAMYGLEVRQGWFEEHGIEEGDQAVVAFGGGTGF